MTADRLAEIRARAEAATEGPWRAMHARYDGNWSHADIVHDYTVGPGRVWPDQMLAYADLDESDAEFIAHAREDVPWLLAEVERLRAETSSRTMRNQDDLDRAEAECDTWRSRWEQLMRDHEKTAQERDRAEATISRVRELHYAEPGQGPDYCAECEHRWPCPTLAAIEGTDS